MSEMIERVAQAICGDSNPDNILTIHRIRARAAIEAMRKPTDAMALVDTDPEDSTRIWRKMIDEALR